MASGHVNRANRPDTWLHRPILQNVKKPLANPEPSTHGTTRKSQPERLMSASGGKPENICSQRVFRVLTRTGHGCLSWHRWVHPDFKVSCHLIPR
jgi:hypothetical protein